MTDTNHHEAPAPTRYRLHEEGRSRWQLGWDQPLGTFYVQRFDQPSRAAVPSIVEWVGVEFSDVSTIQTLAALMRRPIPADIQQRLDADRPAFAFRGPPDLAHTLDAIRHTLVADPQRVPSVGPLLMATGYRRSGVVLHNPRTGVSSSRSDRTGRPPRSPQKAADIAPE